MQENRKRKASCLDQLQDISKLPNCLVRHCVEPFLQKEFNYNAIVGQLNFIFNSQNFSYVSLRQPPCYLNFSWSNFDTFINNERLRVIFFRISREKEFPEKNYPDYFNSTAYGKAKMEWFMLNPDAVVHSNVIIDERLD